MEIWILIKSSDVTGCTKSCLGEGRKFSWGCQFKVIVPGGIPISNLMSYWGELTFWLWWSRSRFAYDVADRDLVGTFKGMSDGTDGVGVHQSVLSSIFRIVLLYTFAHFSRAYKSSDVSEVLFMLCSSLLTNAFAHF